MSFFLLQGFLLSQLVDKYLSDIYPQFIEHTRTVLIRQARDILVCTFHGDLSKFEENFLVPAATIGHKIKDKFADIKVSVITFRDNG